MDVGKAISLIFFCIVQKLLTLWLDSKYRHDAWYIGKDIDKLEKLLKNLQMPSTTSRVPRSVKKYLKFKGSEYKAILHFGFTAFQNILPHKYYEHMLKLVCAINIANADYTPDHVYLSEIECVRRLLNDFYREAQKLYGIRHMNSEYSSINYTVWRGYTLCY
ncbi:unnamed protein product [Didymodactylos carnosus]|uniref:Uncharacterized protein n=1 Tax=Didymodactylos carnosus TaxID=1234261 RepID=A0A8S2DGW2_9BILA|nr:unnamed protein product [Didymodactylos carnosus]CAF3693925.1 unnamed protein product [Didymodactylos carnosus]